MRYPNEIPDIIDLLYHAWIPSPDPRQWPEYLRQDPVGGTASTAFTRGSPWASSWRRPAGKFKPGAASPPPPPAG